MADNQTGRRTFMKSVGAAGATAALGVPGAASTVETTIDQRLDTGVNAELQEALVVFATNEDVERLSDLDLEEGYYRFDVLPIGYTKLTGEQLRAVADWDVVHRVSANYELEYENASSKESNNVNSVRESETLGYTGEGVHAAVVDSGIDGAHPAFAENLEANWRWVGRPLQDPTLWVDVGPADSDDVGHGTHCAGSLASSDASIGEPDYSGMAPDATLTMYSAGAALFVLKTVAAYDHLLARQRAGDHDIQLISNSYGSGPGEFDPFDPLSVAQFFCYEEEMVVVYSAGNDGDVGNDGLGVNKQAPYVMNVAATNADDAIADFSSRGDVEGNFDRRVALENVRQIYAGTTLENDATIELNRPAIAAKGASVMSTMSPTQALYPLAVEGRDTDEIEANYGRISGTSMACPTAAGVVAVFLSACLDSDEVDGFPDPMTTINTIEATANPHLHPDEDTTDFGPSAYTTVNAGAGYIDAEAAVEAALGGDLAGFEDVALASDVTGVETVREPAGDEDTA